MRRPWPSGGLMHKKKSVDLVLENKLIETLGVRNFKNKKNVIFFEGS